MTRVDAHQHFWRLSRGDYRWLTPALAPLYRDFAPSDLLPHLKSTGVRRTVLVQAADSLEETRYLLSLARGLDFVAGVVGWVDLEAPNAVETLESLATDPKFVGVRPMIQDIDDDEWMLRPTLTQALDALPRLSLRFDALVKPRHLRALRTLAERHPELDIVIDHGAKPTIRRLTSEWPGWNDWRADMKALSELERVHIKLSGLVTEAEANWNVEELRPFFDVMFDAFGATRILWGSDWPVVELAGGYSKWWTATARLLGGLAARERDQVLGLNAERFYRLARSAAYVAPEAGSRRES